MIYIYTESLFFLPKLKNRIKKIFGKYNRGPQAVEKSLFLGLNELRVEYHINDFHPVAGATAAVLSGIKTLKWAIMQKKAGKIKRLIAGPNIAVTPEDSNEILKHPLIDLIIVPSEWVKNYFLSFSGILINKLNIWAAGVQIPLKSQQKKNTDFLIYNKIGAHPIFYAVQKFLKERNVKYKVLNYGAMDQEVFFDLLDDSKYLIYLSESESQGLAMFEAWARDVPVFIWEKGVYYKNGKEIFGDISAPYLTEKAGRKFRNIEEFEKLLDNLGQYKFEPRQFIEANYTNIKCAEKYLNIVYSNINNY